MCLRMKKSPSSAWSRPSRTALAANSLSSLTDAAVGDRDALGADLEDEPLVLRQELLGEGQVRVEALVQPAQIARGDQRLCHRRLAGEQRRPRWRCPSRSARGSGSCRGCRRGRAGGSDRRSPPGCRRSAPRWTRRTARAAARRTTCGAVRELALVQDGEQRVQDRRVRLEDLVEEDDLGLGQHGLGPARVAALAEGADVDRAEELVRLGEAREQVLEVARVDQLARRCASAPTWPCPADRRAACARRRRPRRAAGG